jgi:hypothetical protein
MHIHTHTYTHIIDQPYFEASFLISVKARLGISESSTAETRTGNNAYLCACMHAQTFVVVVVCDVCGSHFVSELYLYK